MFKEKITPIMNQSPLGQKTVYVETYTPELLFPIPRSLARDKTGLVENQLPFDGFDIWNGFEISWLNAKGKPVIAMAEFVFPCVSKYVVESKSFKLYLNSFNQSRFDSVEQVRALIQKDLSAIVNCPVDVRLWLLPETKLNLSTIELGQFSGVCLDDLDVEIDVYEWSPQLLKTTPEHQEEVLFTNLFKSNCLATGQPDWGAIWINYSGFQINHESLLKYLISFRRHAGFGEHCVEQIYFDLMNHCHPERLTVYGRFTRRGGLDINPFRSNFENKVDNIRQYRQ